MDVLAANSTESLTFQVIDRLNTLDDLNDANPSFRVEDSQGNELVSWQGADLIPDQPMVVSVPFNTTGLDSGMYYVFIKLVTDDLNEPVMGPFPVAVG